MGRLHQPRAHPRWFLPVSGDLRPGGRYALEGNASGTIERCEPPHGFDATWEYGGRSRGSRCASRPRPTAARGSRSSTSPTSTTSSGPSTARAPWASAGTRRILGLTLHLASGGEPVDREAVEAWQVSDEGRQLHPASSERWAEASIAAGTDAAEAQAAAARTTDFYTGEPAA